MRGQANLPALAVALLVVTTAASVGFGVADGAFASGERDAGERRAAVALSERFVAADGPLATDANVLNGSRLGEIDESALAEAFPVAANRSVEVRLGDRVLVRTGETAGGATIRRLVLVERVRPVTVTPSLSPPSDAATLPRRTASATLTVDPPPGTTVGAVRANDRVVLRNESGLRGTFDVRVPPYETVRFAFAADGPLPDGSVELTYYPAETSKAVLAVTVDG